MASIVYKLKNKGLIAPPPFLVNNVQYETMMGSVAYGVNNATSDVDIYGFCIPPKNVVFPHLAGEIFGFGRQHKRFEQWQQHHIKDISAKKEYDFQIYNIVKYFHLCMENNPNMIDSLFVPQSIILHSTKVGNMVRENRHIFLHKGCWHKFKGYSYSQLHKIGNKEKSGKRKVEIDKYGYSVKFAYHVVRLLNEVEMILIEGDLDLMRNREQLKSIRRGEWTEQDIREYFEKKEPELETLYINSKLPHSPDENRIKQLLLDCLEEHYGDLSNAVVLPDKYYNYLIDIKAITDKIDLNK